MYKSANSDTVRAVQVEFGSFNGGKDGEYNGVSLVKISHIFVTQHNFLL